MTSFDKALEEKATKAFVPGISDFSLMVYKEGAKFGRQFTIAEVCEWLKNRGCVCMAAWNEECLCEDYESVAEQIESHFKDRGEKV